jgi:hydrogenase small subunit
MERIDILWITAGLGCDGDTVAMTGASHPSIEDVLRGNVPGLPQVRLYNPLLAYQVGDEFMQRFHDAANGVCDVPFILIVEGSIPDESNKSDGYWAAMGQHPETREPILTCTWVDRLAPKAWAVVAAGTCAAYGGVHAMEGNPTGCMGLADYLGKAFRSAAGIPIINVPGCPVQPDNFMDTLGHLLRQAAGNAPMIPLDHALRPRWLFELTVHEGCDRGSFYEQADFAGDYNSPKCQVKVGCWGPVVVCNVPKRGWMGGIGGCPNVGGVCIGCTMPGFPDKFMPHLNEPPGAYMSTAAISTYGTMVRALRRFTRGSMDVEPEWRKRRDSPGLADPLRGDGHGGE